MGGPGYVWLKSGYSEAIPWRKVRLTKQRNVELTTDGLWAMPLKTGWVPAKERRLQDWEKLKKNVPVHNRAMFVPILSQPCLKKATQMMMMIQNKCDGTMQCMCMFLKRTLLTDFKKYPPPPCMVTCLHIGAGLLKKLGTL